VHVRLPRLRRAVWFRQQTRIGQVIRCLPQRNKHATMALARTSNGGCRASESNEHFGVRRDGMAWRGMARELPAPPGWCAIRRLTYIRLAVFVE
jgi:allantoicase